MTRTEARNKFFQETIVVQYGHDPHSREAAKWFRQQLGSIPEVKIEYVELEDAAPFGVKIFHRGDVIVGERVGSFVAYAQKMATQ